MTTSNGPAAGRRGRVFIRQSRATGDWRTGSRSRGAGYLLTGVLEVGDNDPWEREVIHGFATLGEIGLALTFEGGTRALDSDCGASDLPSVVAHNGEYQRPNEIMMAMGWGGGGLVLRDTRAPSAPGTTLALITMALCLPTASLPDAHMADIFVEARTADGAMSRARLAVTGPCPIATAGMGINSVAKLPLWGWGDEPHGFSSLLRLDVIDACSKLQRMILDDSQDLAEIKRLRRQTMDAVHSKDPAFMRYLRLMDAKGLVQPWDATPTASQIKARADISDALVKSQFADA